MITRFLPLLLAVGCIEVEVEAPSVCLQAAEIEFSTGPLPDWLDAPLDGPVLVEEHVDSQGVELPEGLSGELWMENGRLASEGALDFVEAAFVEVLDAEGTPQARVLSYDRELDGPPDDALEVRAPSEPVDVLQWMSDGVLSLGIGIEADPSTLPEDLQVDAHICLSGEVRFVQRWIVIEDR